MKRLWSILILLSMFLLAGCNLGTREANNMQPTPLTSPTTIAAESTPSATTISQPTTVPTATTDTCTPINGWQTYIIQSGDTISSIASKTNSTIDELIAANCLTDPNRITVGETLFVPTLPEADLPPTEDSSGTATFTEPGLLAFDYPASWIVSQFTGGLGGAMVGTMALGDEPPTALRWDNDMVTVSFTPFPEEFVPDTLEDWVTEMRNEWDSGGRTSVLEEPAAVTLPSGISGYMMTINAANHNQKVYYLDINGQFLAFTVAGNIEIGDPVALTLRPA